MQRLSDLIGLKILDVRRGEYGLLIFDLEDDISVEIDSDPDKGAVLVDIVEYKNEKVVTKRTTLAE